MFSGKPMKLSHVSYILTPLLFTFSAFEAVADSSADNDSTNVAREVTGNELSYDSMISSHNQLKCLYGYAAEKTGDHAAALAIFNDCIERFDSVYAMIWLAQMYETGVAVEKDLAKATALMKRGANTNDAAGYSSLAKYHYGVALIEGRGVVADRQQGIAWLKKASLEGVIDADEYLTSMDIKPSGQG